MEVCLDHSRPARADLARLAAAVALAEARATRSAVASIMLRACANFEMRASTRPIAFWINTNSH